MRSIPRAALAAVRGILAVAAAGCGGLVPASLEFVDVLPAQPRIGDVTTVRFRAVDNTGQPMAGAQVDFTIPDPTSSGGVTLSPLSATSNRGDGIASTQIIASGARPSAVVVQARAGTLLAVSPPVTFSGGTTPNGRQLTFQCGSVAGQASGGVHAIGAYDQTRYLIAGVKLQCHAHIGDRNGDGIPNVLVSFLTEAGTIGASGISLSDVVGNAEVLYKTSYPLPKDVVPAAFTFNTSTASDNTGALIAPLWMHPFAWDTNPIRNLAFNPSAVPDLKEPRRSDPIRPAITLNPRDNLVAMIAVTAGEEGFLDVNNNGRWDAQEPFEDLTEPFVDNNDNGTWDPDERWIDTNGNGRWDGKNGAWDGNTLIWVQERITWTGMPSDEDRRDTATPVFGQVAPPVGFTLLHWQNRDVIFALSDPWFNSIAQNGETDGCGIPNIDGTKLINVNPTDWARGIRFTYPAFTFLQTNVADAHDPLKNPPDPAFGSAVAFAVPAVCQFTASPDQGYQVVIGLTLGGSVF